MEKRGRPRKNVNMRKYSVAFNDEYSDKIDKVSNKFKWSNAASIQNVVKEFIDQKLKK